MRVEIWSGPVTDELVEAFQRLTPHLSKSNPAPDAAALAEIVSSPASEQFVVRDTEDGDRIVGVATLVVFRIPTGWRAWVEDVIADPSVSGRGVGELVTVAMVDRARERGCKTIELTSRPSREAANHVYQKVGFQRRDTNVYRYDL